MWIPKRILQRELLELVELVGSPPMFGGLLFFGGNLLLFLLRYCALVLPCIFIVIFSAFFWRRDFVRARFRACVCDRSLLALFIFHFLF